MKSKQPIHKRRVLKRYSAEDRERLIQKYKASGQSKAAFCRAANLNLGTFSGWLKRYSFSSAGFAEVTVSGGAGFSIPMAASPRQIEVLFPGGVRVLLPDRGSPAETGRLVREVAGC